MMADILKFPEDKIKRVQYSSTEDEDSFKKNKQKFVEKLVEHYGIQLLNKLAMHGFDVEDNSFMYDYIFSMEALKSCLYRNVGLEHPLQRLSDMSENIVGESDFDIEEDED